MEKSIEQPGKLERRRNNAPERKYLDMIIEGKLKDPTPSVIKKISSELGLDIFPKTMDK